ncbi:MAG: ACT domain-containing protein [Candidatus Dormiibacterota bacterium]
MDSPGSQEPKRQRLDPSGVLLVVCRLPPGAPVPGWAVAGEWWSLSRTPDELSLICEERFVPAGVAHGGRWKALRVQGPLDHELVGVLAAVAESLASAQIPIFAISTHDTDWVLVPEDRMKQAVAALEAAGHDVGRTPSPSLRADRRK